MSGNMASTLSVFLDCERERSQSLEWNHKQETANLNINIEGCIALWFPLQTVAISQDSTDRSHLFEGVQDSLVNFASLSTHVLTTFEKMIRFCTTFGSL